MRQSEGTMDSNKEQGDRAPGTTSIAPGVLVTLAKHTALRVPGVVGMAPLPGGVNRIFRPGSSEGVRIEVQDGSVRIDLHLILAQDTNVRDVSRKVQAEVTRAIEEMVGMDVVQVNVHIEDIRYTESKD